MAVSIGTNSEWGHLEYSGLGSLNPGQIKNLSGNDLRFVLNTSKTIAKDETVTIDKALIITAQDANASVSSWLSPAYVTINLKGVEENHAPKLEKVEDSVKCASAHNCSVDFKLTNPQNYPFGVRLMRSEPNQSNIYDKGQYKRRKDIDISLPSSTISNYQFRVDNLESNSTYGFFVRGCLTEACGQ